MESNLLIPSSSAHSSCPAAIQPHQVFDVFLAAGASDWKWPLVRLWPAGKSSCWWKTPKNAAQLGWFFRKKTLAIVATSKGCDSKYDVSKQAPTVFFAARLDSCACFRCLLPPRCNNQPALAACRCVSRSTNTRHILLCQGDIASCIIDGAPVAFGFDGQVLFFLPPPPHSRRFRFPLWPAPRDN